MSSVIDNDYNLRAIIVSVDYGDLLSLTLAYNRCHFSDVCIVTSPGDSETHSIASQWGCKLFITDSFYKKGANFNKWLALEEGLDYFGRWGWLCIMDADILWPKKINIAECMHKEYLYSPLRRMMTDLTPLVKSVALGSFRSTAGKYYEPFMKEHNYNGKASDPISTFLPVVEPPVPETSWSKYPIHPNVNEWAGYSQIFHCEDSHLGDVPWHQTNWKHAGGADSFFQAKWPSHLKIRPGWQCLHLGCSGLNWMGRATERLDGIVLEGSDERLRELHSTLSMRRGKVGDQRFEHEKIT